MFSHPQQGFEKEDVLKLRQEAGRWLKAKREEARLSQRELAKAVGIEYYTFISQIESGRGRVPPAQMKIWADAIGMPARDFAIQMMRYYDPLSYELVFGDEAASKVERPRDDIETRIARLEVLMARK